MNLDIIVGPEEMADNNFLFYGDNLDVMRKHIKDETVDLCYVDPPFNSDRNYNQIYNNVGKRIRHKHRLSLIPGYGTTVRGTDFRKSWPMILAVSPRKRWD